MRNTNVIARLIRFLPYAICILFFAAYSVLSIVRHNHYQSFGYDLGINDQAVWLYSHFKAPVTTIDPFPDKSKLYEHVELIYAFISPSYWIWDSRKMLLLLRNFFVCSGGIAVFLLARKRKISYPVSIAILVSYLGFFGVQNAIWFDVHSVGFATGLLAWFLYCFDQKKRLGTVIFFFFAITAKENIAVITFAIALVYFIMRRDKLSLMLMLVSIGYLFFIFFIYFPHIIHFPYLYQNQAGLTSNFNPLSLFDTGEKLQTEFYTVFSYGFLPLLAPLSLLPVVADLATYFVFGSDLSGAQGLFMHYRETLAPLLAWAAITTINERKFLNTKYTAIYLLLVCAFIQYTLHLPLSYLSKSWFWTEPVAAKTINTMKDDYLPPDASVVSQNNITPHISHREKIYTLYPEKKDFGKNSPCGEKTCNWFRWFDHPQYLIVDTSSDWDIRHLLANREDYIDGLHNIEKAGIVQKYKQIGTTTLYKVIATP